MNLVLLEAESTAGLPPILTGIISLAVLLTALGIVVVMGMGRPNSK